MRQSEDPDEHMLGYRRLFADPVRGVDMQVQQSRLRGEVSLCLCLVFPIRQQRNRQYPQTLSFPGGKHLSSSTPLILGYWVSAWHT
jgi:hypothetical protein